MIANRSVPDASVIPVLAYADVAEATDWLCSAFAFRVRLRIGKHRAQLLYGEGAVIVTQLADSVDAPRTMRSHAVHLRVDDAASHHQQAVKCGARIIQPPTDYPYGERQYTAEDLGGHHWTFSESIADVDPASWGGTLGVE